MIWPTRSTTKRHDIAGHLIVDNWIVIGALVLMFFSAALFGLIAYIATRN